MSIISLLFFITNLYNLNFSPKFWKYLLKTKSWAEKTYPKGKTIRLMETLFEVEEKTKKLAGKNNRVMVMKTIKLDRPNPRINERQKEPWE